jgi:hypothetical protein
MECILFTSVPTPSPFSEVKPNQILASFKGIGSRHHQSPNKQRTNYLLNTNTPLFHFLSSNGQNITEVIKAPKKVKF